MPINNNLQPIKSPITSRFYELPTTEFYEHLMRIKATLLDAPSIQQLKCYIPEFVTATWRDKPDVEFDESAAEHALKDMFNGLVLPTALETISLTFRVDGLDMIDVTHLIRHRTLSFSAQCTGDRDLRHDDALVKASIINSKFASKFNKLVIDAKQLYAEMVDSKDISIFDARTILPRCLSHFYYVRGNLKDILAFIRTRLDEQIQPQSDNVVAMKMFVELCKQYPILKAQCNIGGKDYWYIKTASTNRSSNVYPPKSKNDVFEYNEEDFLYKKRRDEFAGNDVYDKIKQACIAELMVIRESGHE